MTAAPDIGPAQRRALLGVTHRLIAPFLAAGDTGILRTVMPVVTHDTPEKTSRMGAPLEALARILSGIAPMLETGTLSPAPWQDLLDAAMDPVHPGYLGAIPGHRGMIEGAFLAQAIYRAPSVLWDDLPAHVRANVVAFLHSTRTAVPCDSNWLLFSAMIETLLQLVGESHDRGAVRHAVAMFRHWYAGDGIYGDGPEVHVDYYNSFVIHPMLLDVTQAFAGGLPRFDEFAANALMRAQRHAETLERMIAPDGTFPPLGRSLSYRCGAFHLLAELARTDRLPASLPRAQVRGALHAVITRTLGDTAFRNDGWLTIGLNGAQAGLGERYITTGSLYLCSTALLPLGLSADHAFWTDPPVPFTQQAIWGIGSDALADKPYIEL